MFYIQWIENLLFVLFAVILDSLNVIDCQDSIVFECVDKSVRDASSNVIYTVYFSVTFALLVLQMILFCTLLSTTF